MIGVVMFLLDTDHITIIQWQTQPAYDRLVKRMDPLSDFFFPIVSFHAANVFAGLRAQRIRISTMDLRIASIRALTRHGGFDAQPQ